MDQCRPDRVPVKLQAGVNNYFSAAAKGDFPAEINDLEHPDCSDAA